VRVRQRERAVGGGEAGQRFGRVVQGGFERCGGVLEPGGDDGRRQGRPCRAGACTRRGRGCRCGRRPGASSGPWAPPVRAAPARPRRSGGRAG
jgi:hypothetical protein